MLKGFIALAAFTVVSPVFASDHQDVSTLANINANNSAINPSPQTRDLKILPTHNNVANLYKPDLKLAQAITTFKLTNLTGVWKCDDGGTYYLRQVGNQVWWYGESSAVKPVFSNVFNGTISPENYYIIGNWAEVPKGTSALLDGGMLIQITSPNTLQASVTIGSFHGFYWTRQIQ